MRIADLGGGGLARRLGGVCAALAVGLSAGPALANWPHAGPAQPLVQARRVCAPNIVPIDHRCRVVDFTPLAAIDGRSWYYAFYATHWADRHGRMNRGYPVLLYLEPPATLRLGLWVNDAPGLSGRWAWTPPPRPVLVRRGEDVYLGMTLANSAAGAPDQRLFHARGRRWAQIRILDRSPQDRASIEAAVPRGCAVGGDALFDWNAFQAVWPLKTRLTAAPCGKLVAGLTVRGDRLTLIGVRVQR